MGRGAGRCQFQQSARPGSERLGLRLTLPQGRLKEEAGRLPATGPRRAGGRGARGRGAGGGGWEGGGRPAAPARPLPPPRAPPPPPPSSQPARQPPPTPPHSVTARTSRKARSVRRAGDEAPRTPAGGACPPPGPAPARTKRPGPAPGPPRGPPPAPSAPPIPRPARPSLRPSLPRPRGAGAPGPGRVWPRLGGGAPRPGQARPRPAPFSSPLPPLPGDVSGSRRSRREREKDRLGLISGRRPGTGMGKNQDDAPRGVSRRTEASGPPGPRGGRDDT